MRQDGAKKGRTRRILRPFGRGIVLLAIALVLTTSTVVPETEFDLRLLPMLGDRRFDWISWETGALWEELEWRLAKGPARQDLASQTGEVLAFLDRQSRINELESQVRREYATKPQKRPANSPDQPEGNPQSFSTPERELEALYREQEAIAFQVERILAAQVGQVLVDNGFRLRGNVWPPVTFRFNGMPTYLVISPRDDIRLYRGVFMLPDMPEGERARLESTIEKHLRVSTLVDDVGGISSWPTMVTDTSSLSSLLDIIAHEWTHTYLYFRPLGLRYGNSRDLTTMNETVASLAGAEVADMVLTRYYPELLPAPPESDDGDEDKNIPQPSSFDLAMRRIRLRVDDLLAEERVLEAETYMEEERQKLVEEGHLLRRLNQAYFAFHGSYATSPSSVDPIGPWMRQFRAESDSLKDFLDGVGRMHSLDDLLQALEQDASE